jgi:hypothetical protein
MTAWPGRRPRAAVLSRVRGLLEDAAVRKTAHNAKFDLVALRAAGIRVRGLAGDSMVASYVLDATRSTHRMDALAEAVLGHRCIPITDLIGSGRHQRRFDAAPLALAGPYAAEDADVALRLALALEARPRLCAVVSIPHRPLWLSVPRPARLVRRHWRDQPTIDEAAQDVAQCTPGSVWRDLPLWALESIHEISEVRGRYQLGARGSACFGGALGLGLERGLELLPPFKLS